MHKVIRSTALLIENNVAGLMLFCAGYQYVA